MDIRIIALSHLRPRWKPCYHFFTKNEHDPKKLHLLGSGIEKSLMSSRKYEEIVRKSKQLSKQIKEEIERISLQSFKRLAGINSQLCKSPPHKSDYITTIKVSKNRGTSTDPRVYKSMWEAFYKAPKK